MNKLLLLKIVNPLLGLAALCQVLTGALHDLLSHDQFEILHKGGGVALASAALLHLYLNRDWVKANYFPGRGPGGQAQ